MDDGDAADPGIDPERVGAWLAANVEGVRAPVSFSLIPGGRSNLTYVVTDAAGRTIALRRPPVGHLLATAHDVGREHRLLRALWPTGFPVPEPLGFCADEQLIGAPFVVMDFVEGAVARMPEDALALWDDAARHRVGLAMAETLAHLHRLDIDQIGLGDLARREDYFARQIRRWGSQVREAPTPGVDEGRRIESVGQRLSASIPPQETTSLVHGDYRLDNVILSPQGEVRAVLDWELATLGDPMADLGLLLCYWTGPGEPAALPGNEATAAPGFATRSEVVERYEAASGRTADALQFYLAFGYWKLACILHGVFARYEAGTSAGDPRSVAGYPAQIDHLVALADALLG
jgi:aminoglycoside phosphotransferase (APT) family kinase protein